MLRSLIIYTLCYSLLSILPAAAQQRAIRPIEQAKDLAAKQALVIGNSAYDYTSPLRNPANDAKAISRTLRQLGFVVTTLLDVNRRQMEKAIRGFGDTLKRERGVGLFYYAGHGMQVDRENYLLPIDINPSTAADIRYDAVPVGKLLGQMEEAGNGMNLVILDACRNNPFARSFRSSNQGLAQVIAPTGSFISYATAPGQVAADGEGTNGLFTSRLLKHMVVPNLKLEEVFKRVRIDVRRESNNRQVPWDSSSLTGDFFFVPSPAPPPPSNSIELGDLQNLAVAQQQASVEQQKLEAKWKGWQKQMEEDFSKVSEFEKNDSRAELKIKSWERFVENWDKDNPFSVTDTALRSKAQDRLQYWRKELRKVSELEQIEIDLLDQAQQASQRMNSAKNELTKIARHLKEGKLSLAGDHLGNYQKRYKRAGLVKFFAKQPPSIQYKLAQVYRKGTGIEKSAEISLAWYKQSANSGYTKAQTMLGYLYQTGEGTGKDLAQAARWYKQSAQQGEVMAMFNLGNLYRKGYGVTQDESKAKALFRQAAAQGNKLAKQALERMSK